MVFNAVVGNDDDHPRNHAVIYHADEGRWRLAPAFDVVPNPDETPRRLVMQVSAGRWDITRDGLLADFKRFGFNARAEAGDHLDALLAAIALGFEQVAPLLDDTLLDLMHDRLTHCLHHFG